MILLDFIYIVLGLALVLITLPGTVELLLFSIGAMLSRPKKGISNSKDAKIAVIIAAYNEEGHILKTLESLKSTQGAFTPIVIADNCTDKTAELVRNEGVRVIERSDTNRRGKHFALNYAFSILLKEDFDIFLIVDADCNCSLNLIEEVRRSFTKSIDVVQFGDRLFDTKLDLKHRLLRISFNAFVYVRPLGRQGWNLSTGIFGTGFAVKKAVLQKIKIPTHSIAEDTCFHLRLVENGYFTDFNPKAYVISEMPKTIKNISAQRSRWEGGRIKLMVDELPGAIKELFKGNLRMIEPCLDLLFLPLGFHAVLLILLLIIPISWFHFYSLFGLTLIAIHVFMTMILTKATLRDYMALLLSPLYLLGKFLYIFKIIEQFKKQPLWEKTPREDEENHNLKENL